MFEKIINVLFSKKTERKNLTLIRQNRKSETLKDLRKESVKIGTRDDVFWENRGKAYSSLFNSLNGRVF